MKAKATQTPIVYAYRRITQAERVYRKLAKRFPWERLARVIAKASVSREGTGRRHDHAMALFMVAGTI
jgi:hypothetical protein